MAIATTKLVVTSEWQQASASDCTMQSEVVGTKYHIAIGAATPVDGFLTLRLDEPTTFAYKEPVWVRLSAKGPINLEANLNIIQ